MSEGQLKYKCLVLDHDDTVMDSTRLIHHPAFEVFLKEVRPGVTVSLEEYFRLNFHPGFLEYCEQVLRLTPAELDREMQVWTEYVATHVPRTFPGIREIMAEQLRRGGSIAVVSHSLRQNILRDFRVNGLPEPSMVFGWELPREQHKPNPYALDRLMACMDLDPADMLVVDDLKPGYDIRSQARLRHGKTAPRPLRRRGLGLRRTGDPRLFAAELPPVLRHDGGAVRVPFWRGMKACTLS